MKQFVPKEEKIRKTKSVLFWILSEYLERIPIKDKMVNLEQEINLSYIFQDDGLWVINDTRQKKKELTFIKYLPNATYFTYLISSNTHENQRR